MGVKGKSFKVQVAVMQNYTGLEGFLQEKHLQILIYFKIIVN